MRRRFDLTPLGHPIWWASLALLLVNDNLLKGRGVVPGWLTGKLSDFAFMVVAPVVCAALIPRRVPGRRTLAVGTVVGLFVAADLSRAVSDAVVALAARLGLSWRLWPDPTDLLALAVLPVTIWLLRRAPRPANTSARARALRVQGERAGAVIGALACIATGSGASYRHYPFLHNRTAGNVDVKVTWLLRRIACETTPEALGPTLLPSDLDDARSMMLPSGAVAPLDGPPPPGTSAVGLCSTGNPRFPTRGECVAAILEAGGATPVLMVSAKTFDASGTSGIFCSDPAGMSACAAHLDPDRRLDTETLGISSSSGTLRFEVSRTGRNEQGPVDSNIQIAPIDPAAIAARPPAPGGCRETRDAYRALQQSSAACTSDADCTTLPSLPIPGDSPSCAVYVNNGAAASAFAALNAQWDSMCASTGEWCVPPSRPVCRAGACADPCAGVVLPMCAVSCGVDYNNMVSRTACQANFSCEQNDGLLCTCGADGFLTCNPQPLADPSCPIPCLPARAIQMRPPPMPIPDAGVADAGSAGQ